MESFRSFITAAQKTKKCPEGYRFDKKLKVCVPIGVGRYYPYFGGRNGGDSQQTDTSNNNDNQNGNGQSGNSNGQSGNGNNTGNGNGGNGS